MTDKPGRKGLVERAAQFFCRRRRTWPFRWLGQASYLVWRAYENRNFEMETNGEAWCLRQMIKLRPQCVFDVGANVGEYLKLCHQCFPEAGIHAFEIAPPVFTRLRQKTAQWPRIVLNPFGLSDQNGQIEVYCPEDSDYLTTAFKENLDAAYAMPGARQTRFQALQAEVVRGDDYVKRCGIQAIDILKIDVEGMEKQVLHGFREMLSGHKIRLVQFEYNTPNIVSGFLLRDAHKFFSALGYRVGKLYPNYVEFRDYHYRHEDFCGPNMIAVRTEDDELLRLLNPRAG